LLPLMSVHEQRLFHSVQQFPDAEWQLPLMDDAVRKRVATVLCFPANRRLPQTQLMWLSLAGQTGDENVPRA